MLASVNTNPIMPPGGSNSIWSVSKQVPSSLLAIDWRWTAFDLFGHDFGIADFCIPMLHSLLEAEGRDPEFDNGISCHLLRGLKHLQFQFRIAD